MTCEEFLECFLRFIQTADENIHIGKKCFY